MKSQLSFLLLFLFTTAQIYSQEWNPTGETPFAGRYDDVYFANPNLGWTVNGNGRIFKTENGGDTWDEVYTSIYYFRAVEFLDEQIGFAGTLDSVLLRTEDGGDTWTEIQDQLPVAIKGICGFSHAGNHIFGVGIWSYPAFFIKSEDQGLTWTYKDLSAFADGLVECHFINENLGFASGIQEATGAVILKTIDGGENWEVVHNTLGGAEYIWKMDFVNESVAYGSIESFSNPTRIVKTTDGGSNWEILPVFDHEMDIQGIGFANENKGWLAPRSANMYETNDGGLTWTQLDDYPNINRFFRLDENLIYASGYAVYKYADDVMSATTEALMETEHDIISVSPNPFSDELNITLRIDHPTFAKLDVFTLDGKPILNIHNNYLTKGTHQFEARQLAKADYNNGVYILYLRTNEGFKSKKIVKLAGNR